MTERDVAAFGRALMQAFTGIRFAIPDRCGPTITYKNSLEEPGNPNALRYAWLEEPNWAPRWVEKPFTLGPKWYTLTNQPTKCVIFGGPRPKPRLTRLSGLPP